LSFKLQENAALRQKKKKKWRKRGKEALVCDLKIQAAPTLQMGMFQRIIHKPDIWI
jgi:hypothetical protein